MTRSTRLAAFVGVCAALLVPAAPVGADDAQHAFINARVRAGRVFVSSPQMLVRVGQTGRMSVSGGPNRPKFGLRMKVVRQAGGVYDAEVAALVGGAEVAQASTQFTGDRPSDFTLEGGGYTFDVHAAVFSDALRQAAHIRR